MNTEAKFHPSEQMLEDFAEGGLSAGLCVAISAHLEQCESCRFRSTEARDKATENWLQADTKKTGKDYSHLVAKIVNHAQQNESDANSATVGEFHMPDHSVTLPRVLAKVASEGLVWKKLAGGINQAQVTLDDETQCEFIYMKPGSQVPVHRHQGNEITLVLDGSFSDELGHYRKSDFVLRSREHQHQPMSEEGCLCFAVLDSPLTFTRGLARLMNPINRYRFRRATAQWS